MSTQGYSGGGRSEVFAALDDIEFRNYMCTYGDVGDLVPSLLCDKVLTRYDEHEINKQGPNYRMIKLLDILHSRLESLNPLYKAMQETPQTYNDALQLLSNTARSLMQVRSSCDQEVLVQEITELLKEFYLDVNQNFRPCHDQKPICLEDVWVDVEVDRRGSPADIHHPATEDGSELPDYQKCLPGKDRNSSVFKASRLVICFGEPGSGKTTLTRKIGVDWANRCPESKRGLWQYNLVLIVILKNVSKDTKKIWEMVVKYFASQEILEDHRESVLRLRDLKGRLKGSHPRKPKESTLSTLVVLDGYDEMTATCEELEQAFVKDALFGYDVLVTSRPYKLALCQDQHEVLYMCPFDRAHRIEFIEKYYGHEGLEAKKLNELIDANAHLEKLSHNPLLLNFLCLIYGIDRGAFTDSMTKCQLYEELFEHLIRQWKNKTNDSKFDVKHWKNHPCIQALAQLSFKHLLSTNEDCRFHFTQEELNRCMPEGILGTYSVCKLLCQIGLIQNEETCTDQKRFSHWHTSFIEFCAAMWLAVVLKNSPLTAQMHKDEVVLKDDSYRQLLEFYNPWKFVEVGEFLAEMALQNECPRESAAKLISLVDPRVKIAAHLDQPFSLPLPLDVPWSILLILAIQRIFAFQALFEYTCHRIGQKNLKGLLKEDPIQYGQHFKFFHLRPEGHLSEEEHPGVSLMMCVKKKENMVPRLVPSTLQCDYCIVSTYPQCIQEFYQFAHQFRIGHLHIQVVGSLLSLHSGNPQSADGEEKSNSSPPVQVDQEEMVQTHFWSNSGNAYSAKHSSYDHDLFDHVTIEPVKLMEIAEASVEEKTPTGESRVSLSFNNESVEPQPVRKLMEDIQFRLLHPIDELDIYGKQTVISDLTQCLKMIEPQIVVLSDISLPKAHWSSCVNWISANNLTRVTLNKCDITIDSLHDLAANSQCLNCLCLSRITALHRPKTKARQNLKKFLEGWQKSIQDHRLLTNGDHVQLIFCNSTLSEAQQEKASKFFNYANLPEWATLIMFNNEWLPKNMLQSSPVPQPDIRKTPRNERETEVNDQQQQEQSDGKHVHQAQLQSDDDEENEQQRNNEQNDPEWPDLVIAVDNDGGSDANDEQLQPRPQKEEEQRHIEAGPMKKADRDALMKITSDLHDNPILVNNLLPNLSHVLTDSDISRVNYRGNKDGWKWAANDLLMFYQMRAKDLNPMIAALKACKRDLLADKISNIRLASGAASSYNDGEDDFRRVMSSIQSYVRDKYLSVFAKLRPLPQVNRVFDISKIWVNLQFENRTELKDPEDYRACMLSAFEQNRLLLVKGHRGSGKTTAMRRITFDWASGHLDKFDLVLIARYRDFYNDAETVLDLTLRWMKDRAYLTPEHAAYLKEHKNKLSTAAEGRIRLLLLIDGLDEATIKCTTFDGLLTSQNTPPLDFYVLLTSLPHTINERVQCPSPIAFILPWNPEALVQYMRQHFMQSAKEGRLPDWSVADNVNAVISFLNRHRHAAKLIQVPLHLTFLCLMQEDGALEPGMSSSLLHRKLCYALVRRQVALFNAPLYPELLNAFQGEFGTATRCPAVRNTALLSFEALVKGVGVKQVFSRNDLKEKGIDVEMFLKVGFLQTDDEGQGAKYEFPHISLQYYLAADLLLGEFTKIPQLEIDKNAPFALANEEILDDYPVLKELLHCSKISSLEAMMCYLMEMVLVEVSEDRKLSSSIAAFLRTWSSRHNQCIGANIYALELLLRLGEQCDSFSKGCATTLVKFAIQQHNHSARSALSMAGRVSAVRVHECGIMLEDISTVVFSSQPIRTTSAQINENSFSTTAISLCLLEEGTFEFLAQTSRRMGWKEIAVLRADIVLRAEPQISPSAFPIDSVIKIGQVDLDFKHPTHAIQVTPILQEILSFATVKLLQLKNASISDLSSTLSDQRLKDTIQSLELISISFPNDDDSSKLGGTLSSFKVLEQFYLVGCVLGGSQLIDLLSKLKSSTTCIALRLCAMSCLQESHTFTQFSSLLSVWPSIQRLDLGKNNFSVEQIDQLIQGTKSLKLTRLGLFGIPNLRQEHVDAFKSNFHGLEVITD